MNTIHASSHFTKVALLAAGIALGASAQAAPSVTDNFETCKAEAELIYGSADTPVRVRLDDIRRSGRELRLYVVDGDGQGFRATCEVNRKSGEVVALAPSASPARQDLPEVAGGR